MYSSILERMPYFSLDNIYHDLVTWYDKYESYDDYSYLMEGEFGYDEELFYSTVSFKDSRKKNGIYFGEIDNNAIEYIRLINSHPVDYPVYTRTFLLDLYYKPMGTYEYKYCRPSNIRPATSHDITVSDIMQVYPDFDLRSIYDRVMTFGFYRKDEPSCEVIKVLGPYYQESELIDEIMDLYAFGPNDNNIGKPVMFEDYPI